MFHSHSILYALHTVKIEVNPVYISQFAYRYFYGILVFLRYIGIITVCRFAGIKFFV